VILLSGLVLSVNLYSRHLISVPKSGGVYVEGLVGFPRHVNPLFSAANDVDRDITSLLFSSLFRHGLNGELSDDLGHVAQEGGDGLSYDISVRQGAKWHNGEPVTADDVVFTFNAIKNRDFESPLRTSFSGVSIEKKDDNTVRFILSEPYAAFINLLTFGILPASLWQDLDPKNSKFADIPVGSGPFVFKSLIKDKRSGAVRAYTITRNDDYYGVKPYLDEIVFSFFPSHEEAVQALNENKIDGLSYLPKALKENIVAPNVFNFHALDMPQEVAVFFNSTRNGALADKRVRQALAYALPKQDMIDSALGKEYRVIDGPISETSFAFNPEIKKYGFDKTAADKLFLEAGWNITEISSEAFGEAEKEISSENEEARKKAEITTAIGAGKWLKKGNDYLRIVISTIDKPENAKVAEFIKASWEKVGVKTEIEFQAVSDLQSKIIKERSFEALLYGITLGSDPDPYPYWHSSQISKGFNLAGFKDEAIDQLLEETRATSSAESRKEKYKTFQNMIAEEVPALFLYSPKYVYVQNNKIKGYGVKSIQSSQDRFADAAGWYVKTGREIKW
jgi:peptide/nickel transport system substrate-binding protein